jgi:hypothetical protein
MIFVALMAVNVWMANWPITFVLLLGVFLRTWILGRYPGGVVEHEVWLGGVRRGEERWGWEDLRAFWVLDANKNTAYELTLYRADESKDAIRLVMPKQAFAHVVPILDGHLPRLAPEMPQRRRR